MKRKNMRRTPSVSLIGSGSGNGDSSPVSEHHPKEKLKSSNYSSPGGACCSTPRQVIGFNPKVFIEEELPPSPRREASPRSSSSSKSPSGSPRSALGEMLGGSRRWDRKEEGVGLGIVAALSASQEEVSSKDPEDVCGYPVPSAASGGYGSRKTSPRAHGHVPSVFAPSRASPPIPIQSSTQHSNPVRHSPSHCSDENCCATALSLSLAPPSYRRESTFLDSSAVQAAGGGGSRPNSSTVNGGPWASSNVHNGRAATVNWSHNDMDVDRSELQPSSVHFVRQTIASTGGLGPSFQDACHLCKRRLGEGRDIYMYRGDKFCSDECRHQQIWNDERRERCSAAMMKVGSDVRNTSQRTRVMAAGTATAAAA